MRRFSDDAGSMHVLEAVIVASVMVSAVAFVVTFEQGPSSIGAARKGLTQQADDALAILYDTPVTSKFGKDALSAYIAECMNNNCTNLTSKIDALVPQGAAWSLEVSNGYDSYPVYEKGKPGGEAVSSTQTFEPAWSGTFIQTATESVGVGDALLTYALPVFNSIPVTTGGSQLLVKVIAQRDDGSEYVLVTSASTIVNKTGDNTAYAASLAFVDANGAPMGVLNLTSAENNAKSFTLRLQEWQDAGAIPAGTHVTIDLPRGWVANADGPQNAGWTILSQATDKNGAAVGSSVKAKLNASLKGAYKDLKFDATYQDDALDYYPFYAYASQGAYATATLLVGAEYHDPVPNLATPMVALSVPSPMGSGDNSVTTPWTLSAYIPTNDSTQAPIIDKNLTGKIVVKSVEIIEQEGKGIFGAAPTGGQAMGGTWTHTPSQLTWTADTDPDAAFNLNYRNLLNLTFNVRSSGATAPNEERSAYRTPANYSDWTGRLLGRTGWGFQREVVLPEDGTYEGYNRTTGTLWTQHPLHANGTYRTTLLPGKTTYNVSRVGGVEDALYGSYVSAANRTVPVGGRVVIAANVQSVLYTLSNLGQPAGVTLRFYPPWSLDERVPIFEQENLDQDLLTGEVSQMVLIDVNNDGYLDPVIGTTNGRVVSYHGLTGARLQGNSFTANLTDDAQRQKLVAKITAMETLTLGGQTYVVVGTDMNSEGVYVLTKELAFAWKFSVAEVNIRGAVTALDTQTDLTGDGEREIVASVSLTDGSGQSLLYALQAVNGNPILQYLPPKSPTIYDPRALYSAPGAPTSVATSASSGPFGVFPGALVPIQSTADPGLRIAANQVPPQIQTGSPSLPRAGVQAVNKLGEGTSTLFGVPASVLRTYDYGSTTAGPATWRDAPKDLVTGGTSGYVMMANGTVLTQPLYSYVLTPSTSIISANTRSSAESYVLMSDGHVYMTDDAWLTNWGSDTLASGGKAVASNSTNYYFVVGTSNQIWKSQVLPNADPSRAHMLAPTELVPIVTQLAPSNATTYFAGKTHEFRDIFFTDAQTGYVVGDVCPTCLQDPIQPILLKTGSAGAAWSVEALPTPGGSGLGAGLNKIKLLPTGTMLIVGDDGLVLKNNTEWTFVGGSQWSVLFDLATTDDFTDIACDPTTWDTCYLTAMRPGVPTTGALYKLENLLDAAPAATLTDVTGQEGMPTNKPFFSAGWFPGRVYVGANNMILAKFASANWTTMPLNYIENDARAINALTDGTGFIYGGNASNGRIWFLHDYHTQSQAQTKNLKDLIPIPGDITTIRLLEANMSLGLQTIDINVSANGGTTWKSPMPITPDDIDARDVLQWSLAATPPPPHVIERTWTNFTLTDQPTVPDPAHSGRDLIFRFVLNTTGDKTILSPHVRLLKFEVNNTSPCPCSRTLAFDFTSDAWLDASMTTADWNTSIKALRQPLVKEYWTRNVSGEVLDMQIGPDTDADGKSEIWVATGDMLAENSPDHVIYAGSNTSRFIRADNRVYILNGANGHTQRISQELEGAVRQIRLADNNTDGTPEMLYATTWLPADTNAQPPRPKGLGRLYALNPLTLDESWSKTIDNGLAADLELGKLVGGHTAAFVGTQHDPASGGTTGYLWAWNTTSQARAWRIIPDDLGKYNIEKEIEAGWLYGPYVVEVEVEWKESITGTTGVDEVVRSARFYDHFMVTTPDLLSPTTPIYTARLLVWMQDWG